jgi:hypothetical protein
MLRAFEQYEIYMLGNPEPVSHKVLELPNVPGGHLSRACSLIAPNMRKLAEQEGRKHSLIVIGNGEIFDLEDWADDPCLDGLLLIRTGDESLRGSSQKVTEITPDDIRNAALHTLLGYLSTPPRAPEAHPANVNHPPAYQWDVDPTGYPLIRVETDSFNAFIHLFPVTKPQFERFVAADEQQRFDDQWYTSYMLKDAPRASYRSRHAPRLESLFATEVSAEEALAFGRWLGRGYKLLKAEDWCAANDWLAKQTVTSMPQDLYESLAKDARAVWKIIEEQCLERDQQDQPTTLQDVSLMSGGLLEWVAERPGVYCAVGDPATDDYLKAACDPVHIIGPEPRRLPGLGFRLHVG